MSSVTAHQPEPEWYETCSSTIDNSDEEDSTATMPISTTSQTHADEVTHWCRIDEEGKLSFVCICHEFLNCLSWRYAKTAEAQKSDSEIVAYIITDPQEVDGVPQNAIFARID